MEPEALYRMLGRLVETAPQFASHGVLSADQLQWLGRARALIKEVDSTLLLQYELAAQNLDTGARKTVVGQIMRAVYGALAIAELKAPASEQGAFIPAGNKFDAFAAIRKMLQSATSDVLIVDPYLDETILTEFGGTVPEGVPLRLLGDEASAKPSLAPAAMAWVKQYGEKRPLAVRMTPPRKLHDRVALIDGKTAWTVTQSFKDFAKRSPAEIVRADDTASL